MSFQIRNAEFFCKIKEAKGLCGDVRFRYVAQSILLADAGIAINNHFWLETLFAFLDTDLWFHTHGISLPNF